MNPKPDPNSRLPLTLRQGAAARYIGVDYAIPRPNSLPHETVDDKGNGWVGRRAGYLGKFDPQTFTFSRGRSTAWRVTSGAPRDCCEGRGKYAVDGR